MMRRVPSTHAHDPNANITKPPPPTSTTRLQTAVADHEAVERVGVDVRAVAPLVPGVEIVRAANHRLSPVARRELHSFPKHDKGW